jgi:SAM-dependent methyltransferase
MSAALGCSTTALARHHLLALNTMSVRLFALSLLCALTTSMAPVAWAQAKNTDTGYVPQRGQAGKDVIWIPTPQGLIDKMLDVARVGSGDLVYDLGAGDGIIAITAAGRYGARAVGIEYNPQMADFARRKVAEAGLSDRVRIITGDIFKEDFSAATVVTLYLYPDLNMRLRPTILAMKPGTRVVSHAFTMGDWEPDETVTDQSARAFFWVVPAQVEGEWTLNGLDGGPVKLSFRQLFQQVGGMATIQGVSQPLVGVRLRGNELSFKMSLPDRQMVSFTGRVTGKNISGTLNTPTANLSVDARRN